MSCSHEWVMVPDHEGKRHRCSVCRAYGYSREFGTYGRSGFKRRVRAYVCVIGGCKRDGKVRGWRGMYECFWCEDHAHERPQ